MSKELPVRQSQRQVARIDYKVLNNTGERVQRTVSSDSEHSSPASPERLHIENQIEESPISNLSLQFNFGKVDHKLKMENEIKALESKFVITMEEIDDHIDENPINRSIVAVEDIDSSVDKIEKLRSQQRSINRELTNKIESDAYENQFAKQYTMVMGQEIHNTCQRKKIRNQTI